LDVPLRERNAMLLAAGYAPVYGHRPLDDAEMAPVRAALGVVLRGHQPFPAVVVHRHWDLVAANDAALGRLPTGLAPAPPPPPACGARSTSTGTRRWPPCSTRCAATRASSPRPPTRTWPAACSSPSSSGPRPGRCGSSARSPPSGPPGT